MNVFHVITYIGSNCFRYYESFMPKRYMIYTQNDFLAKEFLNLLTNGKAMFQTLSVENSCITYNTVTSLTDIVVHLQDPLVDCELRWFRSQSEPELQILSTKRMMDELSENLMERPSGWSKLSVERFLLAVNFVKQKGIADPIVKLIELLTMSDTYGFSDYHSFRIRKYADVVSYYYHFSPQYLRSGLYGQ